MRYVPTYQPEITVKLLHKQLWTILEGLNKSFTSDFTQLSLRFHLSSHKDLQMHYTAQPHYLLLFPGSIRPSTSIKSVLDSTLVSAMHWWPLTGGLINFFDSHGQYLKPFLSHRQILGQHEFLFLDSSLLYHFILASHAFEQTYSSCAHSAFMQLLTFFCLKQHITSPAREILA